MTRYDTALVCKCDNEALTSSRCSLLSISSSSSSDSLLSFLTNLHTEEAVVSHRSVAPRQAERRAEERSWFIDWLIHCYHTANDRKDIKKKTVNLFCVWCQQDPARRWSETGWSEASPSSSLSSLFSSPLSLSSPSLVACESPPLTWRRTKLMISEKTSCVRKTGHSNKHDVVTELLTVTHSSLLFLTALTFGSNVFCTKEKSAEKRDMKYITVCSQSLGVLFWKNFAFIRHRVKPSYIIPLHNISPILTVILHITCLQNI